MAFFIFKRRKKIPVPKSVLRRDAEEYDLLRVVVDYVNRMRDEGMYQAKDMPKKALPAYYADYYYSQVCNGGHGQFLHNANPNPKSISFVAKTLKSAGLKKLAACIQELIGQKNIDVSALDDRFFEGYSDYHKRMNAWLRSDIVSVPDRKYKAHMAKLLKRDAKRQQRFVDIKGLKLQSIIDSPLHVGYAFASARSDNIPGDILPSKLISFMGVNMPALRLRMATGETFWGLFADNSFALLSSEPPTKISSEEEAQAIMDDAIIVSENDIENAVKDAKESKAGILAALLLADHVDLENKIIFHRFDETYQHQPPGIQMYGIMLSGYYTYLLFVYSRGNVILTQDGEPIQKLSATQVKVLLEKHKKRIESD